MLQMGNKDMEKNKDGVFYSENSKYRKRLESRGLLVCGRNIDEASGTEVQ